MRIAIGSDEANELTAALLVELPRDRTLVVYCHLGERSGSVAQFMVRRGFRDVRSLHGGIAAW